MKTAIEQKLANVRVEKNKLPEYYKKLDNKFYNNYYLDKMNNTVVNFPKVGAFEISVWNQLIFSKLQSGVWPSVSAVMTILNKMMDDRKKGLGVEKYSKTKVKMVDVSPSRREDVSKTNNKKEWKNNRSLSPLRKEGSASSHNQKDPGGSASFVNTQRNSSPGNRPKGQSVRVIKFENNRNNKNETDVKTLSEIKRNSPSPRNLPPATSPNSSNLISNGSSKNKAQASGRNVSPGIKSEVLAGSHRLKDNLNGDLNRQNTDGITNKTKVVPIQTANTVKKGEEAKGG